MMGLRSLILLVFLFQLINFGYSKKIKGDINSKEKWVFLTRFCFLHQLGGMTFDVRYPKSYGTQRLLFYYDTPGQWSYVYKRGKTCEQMSAVATNGGNYFALDTRQCSTFTSKRDKEDWYRCTADLDFHSSRERWWYLALERCDPPNNSSVEGLKLKYEIHMTNGDDLLHQEFSADQFYIFPINVVFFVLYIIMLALSILVAVVLKKKTQYHTTYAMFLAAISIWTLSLLFLVIAWGSYANTGWEKSKMEVFGRILQAASNIIFMLMLILMAKGYTIVRGHLTNKACVKITVFIMLYIAISITLFVWEGQEFDEGVVLFYLESPPGYCMVLIQLIGWLWMTKAVVFTLKHHSNTTAKFYIPFYIIFTIWFWLAPIVIMFAIFAMPKWMREKTVHGVLQFVAFAGHIVFLFLTRPCKANSNFPYNIKTSQIGSMGGSEREGVTQNGHSNMYSISYTNDNATGPNLDIFITCKDGSNGNYSISQAGYPNGRMYPPLDSFLASSSDSPPPSYPQALVASTPEHPENYPENSSNVDLGYPQFNPKTDPFTTSGGNRLPPLGSLPPLGADGALNTTRETTLPPIRGSGLPALETETEERGPPPDYSNLFRAQ